MLFNSFEFIFGFLPLALAGYTVLHRSHRYSAALSLLLGFSLLFYAWWNPPCLLVLLGSLVVNYWIAMGMCRRRRAGLPTGVLLTLGVVFNLAAIGWFKYAAFAVRTFDHLFGFLVPVPQVILPIGISFFTFQQIAYLVDVHEGKQGEERFRDFALFVSFFPQLIAGPIVHHREMMPQFAPDRSSRLSLDLMAWGLTYFILGLGKKVILADEVARYATPVFEQVDSGRSVSFLEAWGGVLAYTFQLYFDFSGYSDMAIGLGAMFGIILPLNFFSPYRASSIIEFWRRWHMTLSRFLRDYLYIPLGGSRRGPVRRQINLVATMVLGGLWHGANWTFILWGTLHGGFLVLNHGWRHLCERYAWGWAGSRRARPFYAVLTLACVVFAWVLFRAPSVASALSLYRSLLGFEGVALPLGSRGPLNALGGWGDRLAGLGVTFESLPVYYGNTQLLWLGTLGVIACFLPNTAEFMDYAGHADPSATPSPSRWRFRFNGATAVAVTAILVYALLCLQSVQRSEFLYYDF